MSFTYYPGQNQHYYNNTQTSHSLAQPHNHHNNGRRRAPRLSASQNSQRTYRGPKAAKEINVESPSATMFRLRFEAGRSFDLEDDEMFCPNLLTMDERQSIHSSSSDRSSLSSGSPESSPLQQQIQPQQSTPAPSLSSAATSAYVPPPSFSSQDDNLKLHQPSAVRTRNAIPIVNPSTGMRVASPPPSISPGMMQQTTANRRW